jgi:hypothetical protein
MGRSVLASVLALGALAVPVAACGGGSPAPPASHGRLTAETASGRSNEAQGSGEVALQRATRPCRLVSRAQAGAIVGTRLAKPIEAPQGPTCIYRAAHGRRMFSLAVQTVPFATLRRQLQRPSPTSVAERRAYCVTVGQPTLYVPLPGDHVLSVQASCAVGKRFALAALRHLSL